MAGFQNAENFRLQLNRHDLITECWPFFF